MIPKGLMKTGKFQRRGRLNGHGTLRAWGGAKTDFENPKGKGGGVKI